MKYLFTALLFCVIVPQALAQKDTLAYDGLVNIFDGKLIAVTRFPGELDVIYNTRFTPKEKCVLESVLLGFSVVKFQPLSGNDTLIVYVYEDSPVPPSLVNLQKTYKFNLGAAGFPSPNINLDDPLTAGSRDVLAVTLDPPVTFSPKRDFIIGMKLKSIQKYAVGEGVWNGFTVLTNPNIAEYERSRRYMIAGDEEYNRNDLATQGGYVGLFMRAIVRYDPTLPDPVDVVSTGDVAVPEALHLTQNYPNPFGAAAAAGSDVTTFDVTLPSSMHATLTVYDALGREVARLLDGMSVAGTRSVRFDARDLPGGVYVARLSGDGQTLTRKMLLLR
jgi:hypothetical protein